MAVRHVYVIWKNPLFHESARLLLKHPDIIWVGATADVTAAHGEIMRLQPDIVLFEKTGASIPPEVMEILEVDAWDTRIIGFSLENNEVSLYRRERQMVVKPDDLIRLALG